MNKTMHVRRPMLRCGKFVRPHCSCGWIGVEQRWAWVARRRWLRHVRFDAVWLKWFERDLARAMRSPRHISPHA